MAQIESERGGRIGVIGDLHTAWDDFDAAWFNQSEYALLLHTGDLGDGTVRSGLRIARSIAKLDRPTLVMPGNNDSTHMAQLAAEFAHQKGLVRLLSLGHGRRSRALADALGDVNLCGYSAHRFEIGEVDLTLIAGRPHSMGGPELAFAPSLESAYGIRSMEDSSQRLMGLVDSSETDALLFFSHNGPTGLGDAPSDIWGCDFKKGGGDWGDPDLRRAIDHARAIGKRVLAVVAGHMHHRVRGGGERTWLLEKDGVLYVNAARVPRIAPGKDDVYRHHVSLEIRPSGVDVQEVQVPEYA